MQRGNLMNVDLLGPVSIYTYAERHQVRAKKVRALLAVLALNARLVVSFDELIDELWQDAALNNPRNALQANALRLRRQLEAYLPRDAAEKILTTSGNGYVLDVPADAVDVIRFERLAATGSQMIKGKPREAMSLLGAAMKLWRGPALADVGDGIRCRGAAVRLDERRLSVQADLMEARLELGGDRALIADLTELVTRHPEQERMSGLLMLALYHDGRQSEAVGVFHKMRQRLVTELGMEPSHLLRGLYQSILTQSPASSQVGRSPAKVRAAQAVAHGPPGFGI
jgi:DNA-binding SARP family transcriptional activator